MLYQVKPFHCPFCSSCFSSRDSGRGFSNFPLLLSCGHSVCESCVKYSAHRHKKIICKECQLPTDLSDGDVSVSSLLPDVYVLGVLNANMKRSLPSLKIKMQPAGTAVENRRRQKQNAPTVCDECVSKEAMWSCDKCEECFCNVCFDHVHSKQVKTLKKHERKPINKLNYNSMIQKSCKHHSNRDLEFFCDQDCELACSHCCVTGKHKGHNVLTLHQKNMACQDELKEVYEAAVQVKKRMKCSEKKLSDIIPTLNMNHTPEITKLHSYFHSLHAALQLREHELIQQIEEINNSKIMPLQKICQQLRNYQQELDDLFLDAVKTLRNPDIVINSPSLIEKLKAAADMPQYLVSVASDEPCNIDTHLGEVNIIPLLKSVGRISADTHEMYELKPPSELPEDYMLDPISEVLDMISITTETESVRSDAYSEDSLHSPPTPLTEKSSTVEIAEDFKHRQYAASHSDKVIVSHIRDPGKFWVQKCMENRKLKIMSDAVNKWCRSAESSKHVPSTIMKGDLYLVQYSADGKWYRARVMKIFSESSMKETGEENHSPDVMELTEISVMQNSTWKKTQRVEVLYVDYGNSELVSVSRFKNIQTRFLNVPGMAKECCLYDIYPIKEDTWSPEAIKTFARFVGNKEVVMMISEERNGVLYVDLCQSASSDITNDVPVSVRDALVFLELGQFLSHKPIVDVLSQKNVRRLLPGDKLIADTKCNVILSHIENPALFYVQQVITAGSLSNLINDMNMTYKSDVGNMYRVYVPYVGMVCAAQYTVDKQWYRAEVLSLPGGAMVEVQYVDFGNTEVLPNRFLRKLFDRFMKLTKQAISCSLAEIKPVAEEGWTPEAKNWMMRVAFKKQLYLKSLGISQDDGKANVLLFEVKEDSTVCLNSLMVENGLASSCGPKLLEVCQIQDVPANVNLAQQIQKTTSAVTEASVDTKKPKVVPSQADFTAAPESSQMAKRNYKENSVRVTVSHVETPSLFYIQLCNKVQEDLKKMMQDMQLIYKDAVDVLEDVNVGGVYAVLHEKENKWYRGSVLERQDNSAKIFFVDYGFVHDVSIGNIRPLADHLRADEAFSLRCHLTDIQPAGDSSQWPKVSVQAFKDMIALNTPVFFLRKDCAQDSCDSLASELYIEVLRRGGALEPSVLEYINVAEFLIEKGFALPLRKKKEAVITNCSGGDEDVEGSVEGCSLDSSDESAVSSLLGSHKTIHFKPKPTAQWKPFEPPTRQHFTAIVTYVDENGSIFLHEKEKGGTKIDLIKKALHYKYRKADHEKLHIPPPIGQACIAKFSVDDEWYRAEIISSKPESVKVLFVDYGNIEQVSLDYVCIDIIMYDIPAQGIECQLSGIEPATPEKKWALDALDFLHHAIVEQECSVDITRSPTPGKPVQISLLLKGGIDIRNILIQMGNAVSSDTSSSLISSIVNVPDLSENTINDDVPVFKTFKKASPLREGDPFQVCVTQLPEPNFVFLQQLKVDEPVSDFDKMRNIELEDFLALMQELSDTAESLPIVEKPELGVAYCAKYNYDNSWYRCEVINVTGEKVTVLFVDYGNSEVISLKELRHLDGPFVDFPVQAHVCRLHCIEPISENGWSSEAFTEMVNILFHSASPLYARVVQPGEVCEVELLVKSQDDDEEWVLAYKKLIDQNVIKLKVL